MAELERYTGLYDYIILGAGPAGLQLAYFLSKGLHRYVVMERADRPGSFFLEMPRSRTLISFNKVHSLYSDPELRLRWDWNSLLTDNYELLFGKFSARFYPRASEFMSYLDAFARRNELNIAYNKTITAVRRENGGPFVLEDADGRTHRARCLIVATGTPLPFIPPIEGIELAEGYERVSFLPRDFEGQRVLILGKGNSALEFADRILDSASLIHVASSTPLRLAWQSRHPGHPRANFARLLDAYQLKMLHSILDCTVNRLEKRPDGRITASITYAHADGEREHLVYDRVVRATGFQFDPSIFGEGTRPELTIDNRFPAMTSHWEAVNVPDMFFAGNLMQVRDFRRASSPFVDGFRYNIRTLYFLLRQRYGGVMLPHEIVPLRACKLAEAVTKRICRTSGLWAQFGFLCDVIVADVQKGIARHICELPIDYVHESEIGRSEHYYTISFEWGTYTGDVFRIERHPSFQRAHESKFLHPIVRRFSRGELISEHHVLEDLLGMYSSEGESGVIEARGGRDMRVYHKEEHEAPALRFFEDQLMDCGSR